MCVCTCIHPCTALEDGCVLFCQRFFSADVCETCSSSSSRRREEELPVYLTEPGGPDPPTPPQKYFTLNDFMHKNRPNNATDSVKSLLTASSYGGVISTPQSVRTSITSIPSRPPPPGADALKTPFVCWTQTYLPHLHLHFILAGHPFPPFGP